MVESVLAADLSPRGIRERRQRAEAERLRRKAAHILARADRLPLRSNGRRKLTQRAQHLELCAQALDQGLID